MRVKPIKALLMLHQARHIIDDNSTAFYPAQSSSQAAAPQSS